jgi:hypothetical protein
MTPTTKLLQTMLSSMKMPAETASSCNSKDPRNSWELRKQVYQQQEGQEGATHASKICGDTKNHEILPYFCHVWTKNNKQFLYL